MAPAPLARPGPEEEDSGAMLGPTLEEASAPTEGAAELVAGAEAAGEEAAGADSAGAEEAAGADSPGAGDSAGAEEAAGADSAGVVGAGLVTPGPLSLHEQSLMVRVVASETV